MVLLHLWRFSQYEVLSITCRLLGLRILGHQETISHKGGGSKHLQAEPITRHLIQKEPGLFAFLAWHCR